MTFQFKMNDPLKVIVVGHDNHSKCEVANALYRKKAFKQFNCNKLAEQYIKDFTFKGINPHVVTTPSLGTPAWHSVTKRLSTKEFKNKCFVYVKDLSSVRVNDAKSIEGITACMPEPVIVAIPYPAHKKDQATKESSSFEKRGLRTFLLKLPVSALVMKPFSEKVFDSILQLKPLRRYRQLQSQIDIPTVGARSIVQKEFSKSLKETPDDEEMFDQIASVSVDDTLANRPSTPSGTVDLTINHWETYRLALSSGKTISYHTRVNVVGYQAAGKTALVRRLQQIHSINEQNSIPSTECLEIEKTASRCIETENGRLWETHTDGYEKDLNYQRMAASLTSTEDLKGKLQNASTGNGGTGNTDDKDTETYSTTSVEGASSGPVSDSDKDDTRPKFTLDDSINMGSDCIIEEFPEENEVKYSRERYEGATIKKNYLSQIVHKTLNSPGLRRYISYWDFAGQATYYTTHQAFMAPAAVYLLVVDLSKPLDHLVKDAMEFRTHRYERTTVLDAVRFWAGSIKAFASDENNTIAPVIVVGTHKDKVEDLDKIDGIFEKVKKIVGESDLSCIAIDNTKPLEDETLLELRDRILDKALGIFEKEVRAHWIDLEHMIILEKEKGEVVLSFKDLNIMNKHLDEPLEQKDLLKFLEHEHCNGFLMFFNIDALKDMVILQPYILVDFINLLLRKTRRDSICGWFLDGTFNQVFLDNAADTVPHLKKYKYELLHLLIHLKIVHVKEITGNTSSYFMPCLLGERPKEVDLYENCQKSPLIRISFNGKLIPPAFFHSLVVSVLMALQLDYVESSTDHETLQVFYHYSRFRLSKTGGTLLEMSWSDSHIFLMFIHLAKESKFQEMDCLWHLKTIKDKVDDILKTYRHENIECIFGMKCPDTNHNSYIPFFNLIENKEERCPGAETRCPGGKTRCPGGETECQGSETQCPGSKTRCFHMVTFKEALSSWIKLEGTSEEQAKIGDCLPDEVRNRQIDDEDIAILSGRIGPEYQRLFMLLGIDIITIQNKLTNYPNNVETAILHLLVEWRKKKADEATVHNFLKCLPKLGINERSMWNVFEKEE